MATDDACPHGVPHGERFENGCDECDSASLAKHAAAQKAARFRARVVETARGLWMAQDFDTPHALSAAEGFERAADEYLRNGGAV